MKTYQKPEVEILETQTEQLMTISGDFENGFDLKDADLTNETSGNLSRELFFFED
jgi:hypothetical protein